MLRHSRTPTPSIERIKFEIDYGLSDLQAIANGEYRFVDPRIDEAKFGLFHSFPLGPIKLWGNLIRFNGPNFLPPVEAVHFIRTRMDLRPAIPFELHTVGAKHRHQQIIKPMMVEDVVTTIETGYPHFQCLTRTRDWERSLILVPADQIQEDDHCHLAIDRFWS